MSLYFSRSDTSINVPTGRLGSARVETLHRFECKVCPLNTVKCDHPKMLPSGASKPEVYWLAEAPGKVEDKKGEPLVGPSGTYLRDRIPREIEKYSRFNNCVRTWTGQGNPAPEKVMIEACRPSIVRDIEQSRPRVIVGLGNVPLYWATGEESGISRWRGRRFPVRVGAHQCWFYPTFHPSYVLREKSKRESDNKRGLSDAERLFDRDLQRIFDELDDLPPAEVEPDPFANLELITGAGGERDVRRVEEYLRSLLERGSADPEFLCTVDYETNSLRPYWRVSMKSNRSFVDHDAPADWQSKILSIAVGTYEHTIAFPLHHPDAKLSAKQRDRIFAAWGNFLSKYAGRLGCHNAGFEQEWTAYFFGVDVVWDLFWDDSMAAAYSLDERSGMMSLDVLCFLHFGFSLKSLSRIRVGQLEDESIEDVLRYNALDTRHTDHLIRAMHARLDADPKLWSVYNEQMRRTAAFVLTQNRGVLTSPDAVRDCRVEVENRVAELEEAIRNDPDVIDFGVKKFKPGTPESVGEFFNFLGYKEVRAGDSYDTDKSVLTTIDHPVAKHVLELRVAKKMDSTYVSVFEEGRGRCVYPDHRVHTSYNVNLTRTGRTSSQDPNMQNMPKRDQGYKSLRRMFVARAGHLLIAADYGQIEARVIAMASKDPKFVQALWDDYDVHMEWAERVARDYPKRLARARDDADLSKDPTGIKTLRGDIKNQLVFPLFFGAGRPTVTKALGVPRKVMDPIIDDFWDDFEGVKKWQEKLLRGYEENGYVECLTYGRRRRAPIDYNQIINTPIQGTASDIVVDAQCDLCEQAIEQDRPWLIPVLNIHDDITSDVPEESTDDALEIIVSTMLGREYSFLNVPLQVEVEIGRDWYNMREVGKFRSDQW